MLDFLFVLPGPGFRPVGGFKVAYEYANNLNDRGYQVGVLHLSRTLKPDTSGFLRASASYLLHKLRGSYRPKWFNVHKDVKIFWVLYPSTMSFPASRVYVATAWDTAFPIKKMLSQDKIGIYLIQGYEIWSASHEVLSETYSLGLRNVAIARWLQKMVLDVGAPCNYIPNGLNFVDFYLENPIEQRDSLRAATLFHFMKEKGFQDVLDACKIVHEKHPGFRLSVFGAYQPKNRLPNWVDYELLPSRSVLRSIYNSASIFITGSYHEGWGLTACEAMQCGCALVATDNAGHREFAIHNENALLSPVADVQQLASSVISLIDDPELRYKLAHQGNIDSQNFKWEDSVNKLLNVCGLTESKGNYK